ncbi:MAG: hypothetical protein J6S06_04290 [Alphaproteobacteria bacterium]|nr:hypothetical protein [Alphaproteobacteria bacterium]
MPLMYVGDIEIVAHTQQMTSPSLHIAQSDGSVYYVMLVPVDGQIMDAIENIVYEETSINTCNSLELPAGIYRVELQGGAGGKPYRCNAGTGKQHFPGNYVSNFFKLNEPATIYTFRGGDGNDAPYTTSHITSGGGASGVDSVVVIGDRIIRATGAPGSRCMNASVTGFPSGGQGTGSNCGGGGGGFYTDQYINNGGKGIVSSGYTCGGGGAGATPSNTGQAGESQTATNAYSNTAGNTATSTKGGDGGNATNLNGDSVSLNFATGGTGGANVSWTCGGTTVTTYGGGGSGGICLPRKASACNNSGSWCDTECVNGGNGGSGSTGTSSTSFIKIHKIG